MRKTNREYFFLSFREGWGGGEHLSDQKQEREGGAEGGGTGDRNSFITLLDKLKQVCQDYSRKMLKK